MRLALLRMQTGGPGGAEATLGRLARGLAAAGHRVTVYGAGPRPQGADLWGPQVAYAPVPVWGGKTARVLSFALNSRRLLLAAPVDVILSLERTLFQQVYRAGDGCHREWLARRTPHISPAQRLAQTLSLFHQVMLRLEKRLFQDPGLRRVIANSRQVKAEIVRHFQVEPGKIRVIYNGLEKRVFRPPAEAERRQSRRRLGAPEQGGLILFVGSGFARKGLAYLLEAFACLTDERTHLWVVGKDRPAQYQRQAHRLGVASRVRFCGPRAEVAPFYQAADVLALPTLYDPCSNVVLEALGCGCPVITTLANGAAEFISPGENGAVLARPEAIPPLAAALEEWLDKRRDPRVSQAALAAVAHLNWETTVSQTLEVLAEAVPVR
jgi:UDP-glucose:(heptosyl)LPS alpha-1,3-glucosyltransferase